MIDLNDLDTLKALLGENTLEYCIGIKFEQNLSELSPNQAISLNNLQSIVKDLLQGYFDSVQNISLKEWIRIQLVHSKINNKPTLNYIRELSKLVFHL